jgi:hypothetical protein
MFEETVRPLVYSPAVSANNRDVKEWLSSLSETRMSTFFVEDSKKVTTHLVRGTGAAIETNVPDLYKRVYSAQAYWSDPFSFTFIRSGILVAGHVVVADGETRRLCLAETVGLSLHTPFNASGVNFTVEKLRDSVDMKISLGVNPPPFRSGTEALHIVLSPFNNYGHWHLHNLTYVKVLADYIKVIVKTLAVDVVRIICPSLLDRYFSELKKFTIDQLSSVVDVEIVPAAELAEPHRLNNIIVCSSISLGRGCRWPTIFKEVFEKVREVVDPEAPKFIYCNRGHVGTRGLTNESELETALKDWGFTIVAPGTLTFAEQRRVFSNARIIVGSHGGALTNQVYSHHTPTVVELTHDCYGADQQTWFMNLTSVLGGHYAPVVHAVSAEERSRGYSEIRFSADPSNVREVCTEALADMS